MLTLWKCFIDAQGINHDVIENDRACSDSQLFKIGCQCTEESPEKNAVWYCHVTDVVENDHTDCCSVRLWRHFTVDEWKFSFDAAVLASGICCAYQHPPQWGAGAHLLANSVDGNTSRISHSGQHRCNSTIDSPTQSSRKWSLVCTNLQELAMSLNSVILVAKISNSCR